MGEDGPSGGVSMPCSALLCESVPQGIRDMGAVVDRGGQNLAHDVNGAAAPLSLAHASCGEGGCVRQGRTFPGTLSRVGQGQWLCHMHPCVEAESTREVWRRGTGKSIPADVPGTTLATGATEGGLPKRGAYATIAETDSRAPVPPRPHGIRFM